METGEYPYFRWLRHFRDATNSPPLPPPSPPMGFMKAYLFFNRFSTAFCKKKRGMKASWLYETFSQKSFIFDWWLPLPSFEDLRDGIFYVGAMLRWRRFCKRKPRRESRPSSIITFESRWFLRFLLRSPHEKIKSEMKVAPRYTLLILLTLFNTVSAAFWLYMGFWAKCGVEWTKP